MEACYFECKINLSLLLLKFQISRFFIKTYSVLVSSTKLFLFSCKLACPDQSTAPANPGWMQREIMMANLGLVTVRDSELPNIIVRLEEIQSRVINIESYLSSGGYTTEKRFWSIACY